jgi:hypothetical protein
MSGHHQNHVERDDEEKKMYNQSKRGILLAKREDQTRQRFIMIMLDKC